MITRCSSRATWLALALAVALPPGSALALTKIVSGIPGGFEATTYPYSQRAPMRLSNGNYLLPALETGDTDSFYIVGPTGVYVSGPHRPTELIGIGAGDPYCGYDMQPFDDGGIVLVFGSSNGTCQEVFFRRFTNDLAAIGAPVQVNTATANSQQYPKLAMLVDPGPPVVRRFVVTWDDQSTSPNNRVSYRIFDKNGTPHTAEGSFQAADPPAAQANYAVGPLADGGFVGIYGPNVGTAYLAQRFDRDGASVIANVQVSAASRYTDAQATVHGLSNGGWAALVHVEPASGRHDLVFFSPGNARIATVPGAPVGNTRIFASMSTTASGELLLSYYFPWDGSSTQSSYVARYTTDGSVAEAPTSAYFEPVHTSLGYNQSAGLATARPGSGFVLWWNHWGSSDFLGDSILQVWTDHVLVCGTAGSEGAGTTLSWTDGTPRVATADDDGEFCLPVAIGWSGTVTPSLAGHVFTPADRTYMAVSTDLAGQDFAAVLPVTLQRLKVE